MPKAFDKTNAMRALDLQKIPYATFVYDERIHSAVAVAASLGVPAKQVFKTLVMIPSSGRPILIMMPGDTEVDPRRLARYIDVKRVDMASKRDAERLTGLVIGGIGALALLGKPFDALIERSAMQFASVLVNGGRRGINLRVAVDDIIRLTSARVVDALSETPEVRTSSDSAIHRSAH